MNPFEIRAQMLGMAQDYLKQQQEINLDFAGRTFEQLVKEGKKVLISSETHKAIDNVFERLPKIAEIRPIRLITSQSKKESEFSPSNLVDNLYHNIAGQMEKTITSYENYTEYKDKFSEEKKILKLLQSKLMRNKKDSVRISQEINTLDKQYSSINEQKSSVEDQKERILYEKEMFFNTYKMIENNQLGDDEDVDILDNENNSQEASENENE